MVHHNLWERGVNKHWKVLWRDETGRRLFKTCENVPEAKAFRTKLRDRGITGPIHLISKAWAYPPQKSAGPRPNGLLWCPYCVSWRNFKLISYRTKEFPTPDEAVLCEVCSIPIINGFVQKYNRMVSEELKEYQKALNA